MRASLREFETIVFRASFETTKHSQIQAIRRKEASTEGLSETRPKDRLICFWPVRVDQLSLPRVVPILLLTLSASSARWLATSRNVFFSSPDPTPKPRSVHPATDCHVLLWLATEPIPSVI